LVPILASVVLDIPEIKEGGVLTFKEKGLSNLIVRYLLLTLKIVDYNELILNRGEREKESPPPNGQQGCVFRPEIQNRSEKIFETPF